MNIIVPMDGNDIDESKITKVNEANYWFNFEMNEGKMQNGKFLSSRDEIEDYIDIVVVNSEKEDVWQFMDEGIAVLVAPIQRYIEDIVEAYLFKELHDLTV